MSAPNSDLLFKWVGVRDGDAAFRIYNREDYEAGTRRPLGTARINDRMELTVNFVQSNLNRTNFN